jgi:hypothetical protein
MNKRDEIVLALASRDRDLSLMLNAHGDLFDQYEQQDIRNAQAAICNAMANAVENLDDNGQTTSEGQTIEDAQTAPSELARMEYGVGWQAVKPGMAVSDYQDGGTSIVIETCESGAFVQTPSGTVHGITWDNVAVHIDKARVAEKAVQS